MAGFFGLFNFEKEGPGINKDGPQKKTFFVFFETFFTNFWKFIPINLVYILISLPILTNGLANVGITHVARNTARDKHSFGLSDFFETIKKNFKQSLIAGIINSIIYGFLIFDFWFFFVSGTKASSIALGVITALIFIFTILNYYLWTLIITFNFSLKNAYMNSFKFVFINFKYNLLCFFVNVLIFAINFGILLIGGKNWIFMFIIELILFAIIYPSFNALLIQYCTFPSIKKYIIDPYYAEHPDEDIEKRKNLGIEVPSVNKPAEDEQDNLEEDSDIIFED